MKLDKLVKTLRRDLAANPMKAAVLGVLLLGGMYFWGPLVWKWVGKKGSSNLPVVVAASVPVQGHSSGQNAGIEPGPTEMEPKESLIAWREIKERRDSDPRARSADYRPEWDQAFQVAAIASVSQLSDEVEFKKKKEFNPQELGLILQGVLIGANSSKAIISGKVYRQDETVTVNQHTDERSNQDDSREDVVFRLVKVNRKMVELERGGKTWQLKFVPAENLNANLAATSSAAQPQDEPLDDAAKTVEK